MTGWGGVGWGGGGGGVVVLLDLLRKCGQFTVRLIKEKPDQPYM